MSESILRIMAIPMVLTAPVISACPVESTPVDSVGEVILHEIVVKARRPDAVVTPDRISYDPQSTLSGSTGSIYDALQSLPGVTVDNNGTIMVNGQKGITLTIDGRKSILTGDALITYLRSQPSSAVHRIELLSSPSAGNDASSSAMTINVRMRRRRNEGFTAGVSATGNGWKAKRAMTGIFGSYSSDRTQLSANYSFIAARNPFSLTTDRPYPGCADRMLQTCTRYRRDRIHNLSASIDHDISTGWKSGIAISSYWFSRRETALTHTIIPTTDDHIHSTNLTRNRHSNIYGTAYLHHDNEENHGRMNFGFDFFSYRNRETQYMANDNTADVDGDMGGRIRGYAATFDFQRKISEICHLSAGAKSSYLLIANGGEYSGTLPDDLPAADRLSSTFGYRENVNALYVQSEISFCTVKASFGLRAEQYNLWGNFSGNEADAESDYHHHAIDLFPGASVTATFSHMDGMTASYSRRISRPAYADLNPFIYIFDDITHTCGNINLRPSVSHNIHAAYSHGSWLRVSLGTTFTENPIVKCYREIPGGILYISPENLPRSLWASLTLSVTNLRLTGWWHASVNAAIAYSGYHFGKRLDMPDNGRFSPSVDCRNYFSFGRGWSAELSATWRAPMAYGQATVGATGSVYAGVRKTLCGNKCRIGPNIIHLAGSTSVPLSRSHRHELLSRLLID
ncbi:MAG: outer membrane beta-barrel protein [Muribaculaceae bacterium]|nr:outer membrane beta-barrel protein [Muribaculaceae bacterium]